MKKIFIIPLLFVFFLMGCATWHDVHGHPVSQSDEYECNKKCGYYGTRQSFSDIGMCLSDCLTRKGYFID
jgi:hypothetical protein